MASLDRRKVIMVNYTANPVTGLPEKHEAIDYVAVEHLESYIADAKTRWQAVGVGSETDHGPGGEDGAYSHHLDNA
jgi:hypothetical protein